MKYLFRIYHRIIFLFILTLNLQYICATYSGHGNYGDMRQPVFEDNDFNYTYAYQIYDSLKQGNFKADTLKGKIQLVKEINGIKIYQYVSPGFMKLSADSAFAAADHNISGTYSRQNKEYPDDEFDILQSSPYNELNPIPSNISLPGGLVFRIQLGVYSKPVSGNTFGGLFPVSYEEIKGMIKYYTGIFSSSEKANKALEKVREYGFSDSFIVPFYNSKKISIEKAKEIEYSQIKL
jgi:hypothetical protein